MDHYLLFKARLFVLSLLAGVFCYVLPSMVQAAEPTAPSSASTSTKSGTLQESDISRFTNTITEIKDFYVQPINDQKLLEDAIRGMLSGLDPHSEYLDKDAYKTLLMTTAGSFGGLGIEVTGEYGVLKVITPIDAHQLQKPVLNLVIILWQLTANW